MSDARDYGERASLPAELCETNPPRPALSRRAALCIAIPLLAIALAGQGCGTLRWIQGGRHVSEKSDRKVHALPLVPDVDFVSTIELGGDRRLYRSDRDLLYAQGNRFYPIVVRGYPEIVGVSPKKSAFAFLEPFAFEMAANMYIFDIAARTLRRVTELDEASTLSVKLAKWYDDRTLYYLQGYRYGTVSHGGDLWRVDLPSVQRAPIVRIMDDAPQNSEIVDFEFVPGHKLIRYVISQYDDFGGETRQSHYCTLDGKPVR